MNIVEKHRELGSYRPVCGVDHKTVKAVVERAVWGEVDIARQPVCGERPGIVHISFA